MSRLYIPGGSAGGRETFDCKLNFRRLEEQRLRLRDLGMIAAYCVKKLNAHALSTSLELVATSSGRG